MCRPMDTCGQGRRMRGHAANQPNSSGGLEVISARTDIAGHVGAFLSFRLKAPGLSIWMPRPGWTMAARSSLGGGYWDLKRTKSDKVFLRWNSIETSGNLNICIYKSSMAGTLQKSTPNVIAIRYARSNVDAIIIITTGGVTLAALIMMESMQMGCSSHSH